MVRARPKQRLLRFPERGRDDDDGDGGFAERQRRVQEPDDLFAFPILQPNHLRRAASQGAEFGVAAGRRTGRRSRFRARRIAAGIGLGRPARLNAHPADPELNPVAKAAAVFLRDVPDLAFFFPKKGSVV